MEVEAGCRRGRNMSPSTLTLFLIVVLAVAMPLGVPARGDALWIGQAALPRERVPGPKGAAILAVSAGQLVLRGGRREAKIAADGQEHAVTIAACAERLAITADETGHAGFFEDPQVEREDEEEDEEEVEEEEDKEDDELCMCCSETLVDAAVGVCGHR